MDFKKDSDLLRRRQFLQLGLIAGIGGLTGCANTESRPLLRGAPEILPKKWLSELPSSWRYRSLEVIRTKDPFRTAIDSNLDLLALSDGWLEDISPEKLRPIRSTEFDDKLDSNARDFLERLEGKYAPFVFPAGFSPWVMFFRNGEQWLQDANRSWEALLDPALKGLVVLPRSPRLVMSISDRLNSTEGLKRLRAQALTYDDKNALNWVLNGDARVAVVPLSQCLSRVRMDPRLSIAFPESGAPLHWTLLVSPITSQEVLPLAWFEKAWSPPLLGKLMADGWIPSINASARLKEVNAVPLRFRPFVLPPSNVWSRCWPLPPLDSLDKEVLRKKWRQSVP